MVQFLLVAIMGGITLFVDLYFENHPEALADIQPESDEQEEDQGGICLFSQSSSLTVKSPVQKLIVRKLYAREHDKFLQKCHQLRNHQVLKADDTKSRKPGFLTCHYLVFRHHHYSGADDLPLIS